MPVAKTTSPAQDLFAPKAKPVNLLPSSRISSAFLLFTCTNFKKRSPWASLSFICLTNYEHSLRYHFTFSLTFWQLWFVDVWPLVWISAWVLTLCLQLVPLDWVRLQLLPPRQPF